MVSGDTDTVIVDLMESLINVPLIDRLLLSNPFVSLLLLLFEYVTYAYFM